jgi:hypothetical protein
MRWMQLPQATDVGNFVSCCISKREFISLIARARTLALACWTSALLLACGDVAFAASRVPLPRPRPAEAPKAEPQTRPGAKDGAEKPVDEKAAETAAPEPSACRLALTDDVAIAPTLPPIMGPGACGGDDIVRLEAVVLPDKRRVPLKPAATLRCPMAAAIAEWVRSDVARIATEAGTTVNELDNFDSFDCRGRNRVAGARISEHGRANAIDVRGVRFANGQFVSFTDRAVAREIREKFVASTCARFTTVLGPGSDGYHEDHVHLDLAERRSGYRICQWEVWDPMPKIAPLLPLARPEDAPPRETAEQKAKREADEKPAAREQPKAVEPAQMKTKRVSKKGAGSTGAFR